MIRARIFLLAPAVLACAQTGPTGSPPTGSNSVPEAFRRVHLGPQDLDSPDVPEGLTGPVLARMQVSAPRRSSFVLHGTLPVPREFGGDPTSGLSIVSLGRTGSLAPMQIEVVSRAPDGTPDVLEVSASVEIPDGTKVGTPLTFDVVRTVAQETVLVESPDVALEVPPGVTQLLSDPEGGPFLLRTRDVFGNEYTVDLRGSLEHPGAGSTRTLAAGRAKRVVRHHGTLVPTCLAEPGTEVPHLMGVHAYITEWAGDDRISLDLRIHNGASSGSAPRSRLEQPAGFIYWDALELVLPRAWHAAALFKDPQLGALREDELDGIPIHVLPLVAAQPGGALHMMQPQAQFHRRLVLSPSADPAGGTDNPAVTGLAFCTPGPGLWSWFQPDTAFYFPQRGMLCTWERYTRGSSQANAALRETLAIELGDLTKLVEQGNGNGNSVAGKVMGWAHPFGAPAAGVTGGGSIVFVEGQRTAACASQAGVQALMLEHRMNASRQAEAAWNAAGDPVGFDAWLDGDGRIPFDFRTNGAMVPPDMRWPARGGPEPSPHVAEVARRGLRPAYDQGSPQLPGGELPHGRDALLAWLPHDGQHMVRYTKNTKALVWLAADALAEDDLRLSAELFHLMFHGAPHREEPWSKGVTLRQFEAHAEAHPGQGAWIGRDQAWGIDSMCAAYSVSSPEWRAGHFDWYPRVARFLSKAAMPSGVIQRSSLDKILGHDRYDAAQTYETLFLLHAMRCLNESVLRGRAEPLRGTLNRLLLRTLDFLFAEPIFASVRAPRPPHQVRRGPRAKFAVALRDNYASAPFSDAETWGPGYLPPDGFDSGVEVTYAPSLLGYAYLLTKDTSPRGLGNLYLAHFLRTQDVEGFGGLLQKLFVNAGRASNDNSGNWASLVGQLQALGL